MFSGYFIAINIIQLFSLKIVQVTGMPLNKHTNPHWKEGRGFLFSLAV